MSTNTKAEKLIAEYKESLTEQEKLVLNIAIEHLESSFDIEKSIGYLKWLEDYKSEQEKK